MATPMPNPPEDDDQKKLLLITKKQGNRSKPTPADVKDHEAKVQHEELQKIKLENENSFLDQQMKQDIFAWTLRIVTGYLIIVGLILAGTMVAKIWDEFLLSDTVLIALLTTTTINVLGLPFLIIKAIFKVEKTRPKADKSVQ